MKFERQLPAVLAHEFHLALAQRAGQHAPIQAGKRIIGAGDLHQQAVEQLAPFSTMGGRGRTDRLGGPLVVEPVVEHVLHDRSPLYPDIRYPKKPNKINFVRAWHELGVERKGYYYGGQTSESVSVVCLVDLKPSTACPGPLRALFISTLQRKTRCSMFVLLVFVATSTRARRGGGVFHPPASLPTVIAPSVMASASSASRGLGIDERRGRGAPPLRAGSWEIARKLLMQHVLLAPQLGENHMHSAT
jgi:hypothetical protein